MSKGFTKEDVIQNKKEAIKSLNKLLETYINDTSSKHLKKANLISYWVKDYVRLINFEEQFEPTKNIAYKRGNIVKINFGFNVGSEYGGLHYGVVLDNKNSHSSPVITVIPLTSVKENKSVHSNNVELGNEIYRALKLKYDTISKTLKEEQEEINQMLSLFTKFVELSLNAPASSEEDTAELSTNLSSPEEYADYALQLKELWEQKKEHNAEEQAYLDKIGAEISQMKEGSIALVNQIVTVSKMRIFDPRNLKGVLAGISLTEASMEQINQKVKELYIF
jgi:mRNA-degrading endonuclease toxin of MazEF toxin-antitoxin module